MSHKERKGKKWTNEEIKKLREEYKKIKPMGQGELTISEIAQRHGRTESAIRNKAYELEINNPNYWTDKELDRLRQVYKDNKKAGELNLGQLAEDLGRLESNICRKAKELGLTNSERGKDEDLKKRWSKAREKWYENHEHPKGMLGKTHDPKSFAERRVDRIEAECPTCGEKLYVRPKELENGHTRYCSLECAYNDPNRTIQTRESIEKQLQTKREHGNVAHNSTQGKREDLDGQYFRSSWEANYARFLNLQGTEWKYEPQTFEFEPIKRGTRFYTPDFWLPEKKEWVEVKGYFDDKSQTKLRRFKKYHRIEFERLSIMVRSLDHKNARIARDMGIKSIIGYNEIKDKVAPLIENWE